MLVSNGYSSGQVAMLPDVPLLADVAAVYGNATAIAWLMIQIDAVDAVQGASAYSDTARRDAASLIYAKYSSLSLADLLLFFVRFRMGEFVEQTARVGGIQRLMTALRFYVMLRNNDMHRLEREAYYMQMDAQREEWKRKAITYEEYLASKESAEIGS